MKEKETGSNEIKSDGKPRWDEALARSAWHRAVSGHLHSGTLAADMHASDSRKTEPVAGVTWPAGREASLRPSPPASNPVQGHAGASKPQRTAPGAAGDAGPHPRLRPLSLGPQPPRQRAASPADPAPRGPPGLTHLALVALFIFFAEVDRCQARQVESGARTRAGGRPQQEQPQQPQPRPPRWRRRRSPRAHDGCFGKRGRRAEGVKRE